MALTGPPNSGKSSLVAGFTHAKPEVAGYPFTTRLPQPGMMPFENIQIQLVNLPPLYLEYPESWVPQAVRASVVLYGSWKFYDQKQPEIGSEDVCWPGTSLKVAQKPILGLSGDISEQFRHLFVF